MRYRILYSVSQQLGEMLPPLQATLQLSKPGPMPQGFPIDKFDPRALGWTEVPEAETSGSGLYRARTWAENVHVLRSATGETLRVSRDFAVYEILRWDQRAVLSYSLSDRELKVPAATRLPLLHSRSCVLCSGQLPRFSAKPAPRVTYVNVSPRIALQVAQSLRQEVDVSDA